MFLVGDIQFNGQDEFKRELTSDFTKSLVRFNTVRGRHEEATILPGSR